MKIFQRFAVFFIMAIFVQSSSLYGLGWELPPVSISTAEDITTNEHVAIDPAGNAVAVWEENDFITGRSVVATYLPYGGVWSAPVYISGAPVVTTELAPNVIMDPFGNATAIWHLRDGGTSYIMSALLPNGGSWSSPIIVTSDPTANAYAISYPMLAVDASGNVVGIWSFLTSGFFTIQAAQKPFGQPWDAPQDVTLPVIDSYLPDIAANDLGQFVAVWFSDDGLNQTIESADLTFGGVWTSSTTIGTNIGFPFSTPRVASDPVGNVVAIWTQFDSGTTNDIVQAATRPVGMAWDLPAIDLTDTNTQFGFRPLVEMDSAGNAVAVWLELNDGVVQSRSLPLGGSWSAITPLSASGAFLNGSYIDLSMNRQGQAAAVWNFGIAETQGANFTWGIGWTSAVTLDSGTNVYQFAGVAVAPYGYAVAAWARNPGDDVIAARATIFTVIPQGALGLTAEQIGECPLISNVLTWELPIGAPLPALYRVYGDAGLTDLLAEIPATDPLTFVQNNISPDAVTTYYIVAVDPFGNVSPAVSVSVGPFDCGVFPPSPRCPRACFQFIRCHRELGVIVTWKRPERPAEPVSYIIYRDAELNDVVAVIPACHPLRYVDRHRTFGATYVYYIVAVYADGGLSEAVYVQVGSCRKDAG